MRRSRVACPPWCAGPQGIDVRCTAWTGVGEHRGRVVVALPVGRLVVSLVQPVDGGPRWELAVSMPLPFDQQAALEVASLLTGATYEAVQSVSRQVSSVR